MQRLPRSQNLSQEIHSHALRVMLQHQFATTKIISWTFRHDTIMMIVPY